MSQQVEDRNLGYKRNEYPTNTQVDEYLRRYEDSEFHTELYPTIRTLPVGTEVIMAGATDEEAVWRTLGIVRKLRSEGKDVTHCESRTLPRRGVVVDRFHDGMEWRTHWVCNDDDINQEIRSSAWESCRQLFHEVLDGRMNSEIFYRRIVGWAGEFADGNHRSPLRTCYRIRYATSPYGNSSEKLVDAGFMMPIDGNDWDIYSANYSYDVVLAYRDSEGEWVDTDFMASDAIAKTHPEHLEWLKSQPTILSLQKPTDSEIEANTERWKDDFVEYPDFLSRSEMSVVAKAQKTV
jgi:hypothetical protein